jgi:phosphate transport system permease protein
VYAEKRSVTRLRIDFGRLFFTLASPPINIRVTILPYKSASYLCGVVAAHLDQSRRHPQSAIPVSKGASWRADVSRPFAKGVPVGVGAGIYVAESPAKWLARLVRFAADIMMGIQSIVIGIFVDAVLVQPSGGFSTLAGPAALAIIMVPLVTRTTEEMILLVPGERGEAALALGVPRWQTTLSVVTRAADVGIATGIILAIARIGGETAPLFFTAFGNRFWSTSLTQPIASLTVQVYTYAIPPIADWQRQAWAGALFLTAIVLPLEIGVRSITRGSARVAK